MKHYGETSKNAGRNCTRDINHYAQKVLRKDISGRVHSVRHTNVISSTDHTVDHHDFLHLSDKGNALFSKNMSDALTYFNDNPEMFRYPPIER